MGDVLPQEANLPDSTTFVLVHGAWHGSWCWQYTVPLLEAAGATVITPDLPIEDPNASFDDYLNVICEAAAGHENITLVGHSRAGDYIAPAASKLISDASGAHVVKQLVFLCSPIPEVGDQNENYEPPQRNTEKFRQGIITLENPMTAYDPELATEVFYQDCEPEMAQLAVSQLRHQRLLHREAKTPLESWPAGSRLHSIFCRDDQVVRPEYSTSVAQKRLGQAAIELKGGHSPFISRPHELAQQFLAIAQGQR